MNCQVCENSKEIAENAGIEVAIKELCDGQSAAHLIIKNKDISALDSSTFLQLQNVGLDLNLKDKKGI